MYVMRVVSVAIVSPLRDRVFEVTAFEGGGRAGVGRNLRPAQDEEATGGPDLKDDVLFHPRVEPGRGQDHGRRIEGDWARDRLGDVRRRGAPDQSPDAGRRAVVDE